MLRTLPSEINKILLSGLKSGFRRRQTPRTCFKLARITVIFNGAREGDGDTVEMTNINYMYIYPYTPSPAKLRAIAEHSCFLIDFYGEAKIKTHKKRKKKHEKLFIK